jgi:hypothetical protein
VCTASRGRLYCQKKAPLSKSDRSSFSPTATTTTATATIATTSGRHGPPRAAAAHEPRADEPTTRAPPWSASRRAGEKYAVQLSSALEPGMSSPSHERERARSVTRSCYEAIF